MKYTHVEKIDKRSLNDLLVLPFWQDKTKAIAAAPIGDLQEIVQFPLAAGDFLGKNGDVIGLYPHHLEKKEKRILLLGLGEKEKCTSEQIRRAYGLAVKYALRKKCKVVGFLIPEKEGAFRAACEGVCLANYAFDAFKQEKISLVEQIEWICEEKEVLQENEKIVLIFEAVYKARDLVNGNADDVTPRTLVEEAEKIAKKSSNVKMTLLDKKALEKEAMGLILAVNRGAATEPALVVLEYCGDPSSKEITAVVGKGITYDTGGLNLKPTGSMETMKCDMAGAAATLAIIQAASALKLKKNIIGVIIATENAIGPHSYKPGDVYRSYTGKTVEIVNTDAEGRLVLADALAYVVKEFKPSQIIDLATLTGAVVVALGEDVTGLFSNTNSLSEGLFQAGERSGERVWRFPLYPEYREMLRSSIADIKNSGGKKASSITAAIFLEEFIGNTPWAHLDIAGTAYLSDLKPCHPTHATGIGVRLIIDFLQHD